LRIPNADRGVIEPAKVHGYFLGERTQYGQQYAIRATLVGPSGSSADVTSVWIVRTGEDFPRFVTAYPEDLR
jgi:hypothetical protein